ncbi:MAG: hypothetical protein JWM98_1465 [Thermoleophilia bacterium]|nr:hypothetical protein [Thermoleophilia bacterium]
MDATPGTAPDVDAMLEALWLARRDQIVDDVGALVAQLREIVAAPALPDDVLEAAAGLAHDLTGIFGALQRLGPMRVFRAACDDLRAARAPGSDVDLDATLAALTQAWTELTT